MVQITIIGRIGSDAKMTSLQDGRKVYSFSLADNKKVVDKDTGEEKEVVNWFNCSYFTSSERVGEHLKKGHRMFIQGTLDFREYYKDGKVCRSNDVTVNLLNIIDYTETAD